MKRNSYWSVNSRTSFNLGIICASFGLVLGILAGLEPLLLCAAISVVILVICFFAYFEPTVIGLLILRSSLDVFSAQQVPAAFAIGLDALTLIFVALMLLTNQKVHIDKFWCFFAVWVGIQSLWWILLPLGGLGLDASYLSVSIREWVRLFSWLMVYLLVMQLKNRISPQKMISWLFLGLVFPLIVASIQAFLPASLPPILIYGASEEASLSFEVVSRLNGTLGHPNTFATFLLLFIGLTCWKLGQEQRRWPWILLLSLLTFFVVSTKALFILAMLGVFFLVLVVPKLNLIKLFGVIIFLAIALGLYASTEFGLERLVSVANTPLLNPDIDFSRSILMSWTDNNSFNWRIAQWTFLMQSWRNSPLLGHGLATSQYLTVLSNYAHNDYIRALVEGGIVGLITFLIFLGAQFLRLLQILKSAPIESAQRKLCWILLAILSALLLGMGTENIWSHTTFFFYWLTVLAVAGWDWNESRPSHYI